MGVFTEVEIIVQFEESKDAQTFFEQINNLDEEIIKRKVVEGAFSTNVEDVQLNDDTVVIIKLNSPRTQNAEWQSEQISRIAKEYKTGVIQFDAVITCPESIIYWEGDDFGDFSDEDDE